MITFKKVSKHFESKRVLDDVDIDFPEGQVHVLLGSSGCGKSTILRLILGLIRPDQGEIKVDDLDPTTRRSTAISSRLGYVIQRGGLFPHLTARRNVSLVARLRGWDEARISERVAELSKLVGLDTGDLQRFPRQLSGGQKQRVSLMRALALDPPILLLDEPLGALDPIIRSDLQEQLRTIFMQLKKTVILVTHDLSEAAFFGDTISLIHEGRILQRGTFSDIVNSPANAYAKKFLDAQRMPPFEVKQDA